MSVAAAGSCDESAHRRAQFAPEFTGEADLLVARGVDGFERGFGQDLRFKRNDERREGREFGCFQPPSAFAAEGSGTGFDHEKNLFGGFCGGRCVNDRDA